VGSGRARALFALPPSGVAAVMRLWRKPRRATSIFASKIARSLSGARGTFAVATLCSLEEARVAGASERGRVTRAHPPRTVAAPARCSKRSRSVTLGPAPSTARWQRGAAGALAARPVLVAHALARAPSRSTQSRAVSRALSCPRLASATPSTRCSTA